MLLGGPLYQLTKAINRGCGEAVEETRGLTRSGLVGPDDNITVLGPIARSWGLPGRVLRFVIWVNICVTRTVEASNPG